MNLLPLALLWPSRIKRNVVDTNADNAVVQNTNALNNVNENQAPFSHNSLKGSIKTVLGNRIFMIFTLGSAFLMTGQVNVLIYVADMVLEKFKDINGSSLAIFIYNMMSICGRLTPGVLGQLPISTALIIPTAITAFAITGCLILAFGNLAYLALIASGLVGSTFGMTTAFISMTTIK